MGHGRPDARLLFATRRGHLTEPPPSIALLIFPPLLCNHFRRYDADLTLFSPEGKLYQVEYVMRAVGHYGCPAVGVHGDGCCVVACKRDVPVSPLQDEGRGRAGLSPRWGVSGPLK